MPLPEGFLNAILESPADDLPRRLACDWLEEHGESERSEFIRVQLELAKTPEPEILTSGFRLPGRDPLLDDCTRCRKTKSLCRYHELKARERELLAARRYTWIDGLLGPEWKTMGLAGDMIAFTRRLVSTGSMRFDYSRGFISAVTLTPDDWLEHCAAILAAAPIERATVGEWTITIAKWSGDGWRVRFNNGYDETESVVPSRDYLVSHIHFMTRSVSGFVTPNHRRNDAADAIALAVSAARYNLP